MLKFKVSGYRLSLVYLFFLFKIMSITTRFKERREFHNCFYFYIRGTKWANFIGWSSHKNWIWKIQLLSYLHIWINTNSCSTWNTWDRLCYSSSMWIKFNSEWKRNSWWNLPCGDFGQSSFVGNSSWHKRPEESNLTHSIFIIHMHNTIQLSHKFSTLNHSKTIEWFLVSIVWFYAIFIYQFFCFVYFQYFRFDSNNICLLGRISQHKKFFTCYNGIISYFWYRWIINAWSILVDY